MRLAAAIDADVGLAQPDFRAEERTFSLLVQLAGRAGREGSGGRVIVQSWEPESRVVRLAARHAVAEFLDGELARRELLGYPPFRRIVRVLVTAPSSLRSRSACCATWPTRRGRTWRATTCSARHRCTACAAATAPTCW